MAAPIGNRFWEARSTHGRAPIFKTPEALWDAAVQYFEWVEANPLWEARAVSNKGEPEIIKLPKVRAMTLDGLQNFIGIGEDAWRKYAKSEDFIGVCAHIAKIIRQQKFEGAAANLLNHAIIARDLGLAEKTDNVSSDGSMRPVVIQYALPDNGRDTKE